MGVEDPGRQKDPAGQARGVVPDGQNVPAEQFPAGAPLEQSMPGGQGAQAAIDVTPVALLQVPC